MKNKIGKLDPLPFPAGLDKGWRRWKIEISKMSSDDPPFPPKKKERKMIKGKEAPLLLLPNRVTQGRKEILQSRRGRERRKLNFCFFGKRRKNGKIRISEIDT